MYLDCVNIDKSSDPGPTQTMYWITAKSKVWPVNKIATIGDRLEKCIAIQPIVEELPNWPTLNVTSDDVASKPLNFFGNLCQWIVTLTLVHDLWGTIDWDCMRLVGLKCTCKYMQCLLTMQKNFARNTWIIWCCACSIHLVCTFISFYCYSWHMTLTQRVPKVILYPLCHIFFVKTSLF